MKHGIKDGVVKRAGPFLIIAGAGSGKTKTIAHRVAHLLAHGAQSEQILMLTFSRRAAEEMTDRVREVVAKAMASGAVNLPWAGTFHSVGARLIREFAGKLGLTQTFTIHDRSDLMDLMDVALQEIRPANLKAQLPKKEICLDVYSLAANSGRLGQLKDLLRDRFPTWVDAAEPLMHLFEAYKQAKVAQKIL